MKCTYCHLDNTIVFDDNIGYVCSECGTILDESLNQLSLIDTELPFKENNDFGFYVKSGENLVTSLVGSVGSDSKVYYIRRKKKEIFETIDKILDHFSLLQYRQHSRDCFNRCINNPEIKRKGLSHKGQIIAACAVIITLREFHIPVNFKEIADIVHTDIKHLGHFFLNVMKCMNFQPQENNKSLELYLPKIIDIFITKLISNTYLVNIDIEKQKNIFHKEALILSKLCTDLGLQEGRNRVPLAIAIVRVIVEGFIKKILNEKTLKSLEKLSDQSLNTIEKRYKEVTNVLIECAKCIGVFSQIRLKTLPKYYSSIMDYSDDFEFYLKQSSIYTHHFKDNNDKSLELNQNINVDKEKGKFSEMSLENDIFGDESHQKEKLEKTQIQLDKKKLPSLSSLLIQMPPSSAKSYLRQLKRKKKLEQVKLITLKLKQCLVAKTIKNHKTVDLNSYFLYYVIEFLLFFKEVQQKLKLSVIYKIKHEKEQQKQSLNTKKIEENNEFLKINQEICKKIDDNDNNQSDNNKYDNKNIQNTTILKSLNKETLSTQVPCNNKRKIESNSEVDKNPNNKKRHVENNNSNNSITNASDVFVFFTIPFIYIQKKNEKINIKENIKDSKEMIYIILKSPNKVLNFVEQINCSLYNILILYLSGLFSDQEVAEMKIKKQQIILGKLKEIVITNLKNTLKSKEFLPKFHVMNILSKPFVFKTTSNLSLEFSSIYTENDNDQFNENEMVEDEDLINDDELNSYILKKGSQEALQRQQLLSFH